jgi:hypothetical protein
LPDPALLDGSTQPAEKKPEQGMLGEFELPGDDNAKGGKVGGQQQPQQMPQGASGGQQMGLPQMSGGGGGPQDPNQKQQQGGGQQTGGQQQAGGQQAQQSGQQGGAGGPESQDKAAQNGGAGGPGDPNAKAEGMQVSGLQTDPEAGGAGPAGQKPADVKIGDSAMQIKTVSNAPGVIGASVPSNGTQQMEKGVGGGRGSSAVSGGKNTSEKGRAMPAGL